MTDKMMLWADAEMIDEFKRLEDVDCLRLEVWIGGKAQSSRDASRYLPRLLELAEIGLFSLKETHND